MLGPILILKIKSAACPCLTSQQDNGAIGAINAVSHATVIYHDVSNTSSSGPGSGVSKLVTGLFKKASSSIASSTSKSSTAKMYVIDTVRGPALSIVYRQTENSGEEESSNGAKETKTANITLKRIGDITSNDSFMNSSSGISIFAKKKYRNDEQRELCRIDLKDEESGTDIGSEERDEFIESLKLIIQWDTERRSGQPDDDEEDEEEPQRQGLGQRALKMKHFAEREIELSKQKRDREGRKARYLKESGGLKYTAVAMANRQVT